MAIDFRDYEGTGGPFRDDRGRFRRQRYDEMNPLQKANHNFIRSARQQWAEDAEFYRGERWAVRP